MTGWIINIVGMIFIGVVLEIILPNGKTNTLIKSVFAIFVLYVIVSPLPTLFSKNLNLKPVDNNNNLNYVISLNLSKISALEDDISNDLKKNGFENVNVIVSANIYKPEFIINKIYIDLYNLVLKNKDEHINTYEEIKQIVLKRVSVNEEDIIFYG